jgi:hypothetical protein
MKLMNKLMKRRQFSQVSPKNPFNRNILDLQNKFDGECQTRIEREKDIMQEVDDTKYKLHKKIDEERTDKSL